MLRQPLPGRELLEVLNRSLEERRYFLVLDILRPVARNIESAEASGMLREFVSPQYVVRSCLADPMGVHPPVLFLVARISGHGVDGILHLLD